MFKRSLFILFLAGTLLHAIVPTYTKVTEVYVATFNRAPDAAGLEYWMGTSMPLEEIATSFFVQPETKKLYPDEMENGEFINTVYNNLFNHDADIPGYNYWLEELNSGRVSRTTFLLAICLGAIGDDATILNNKTYVGFTFTVDGRDNVEEAYAVMRHITVDRASVCSTLNTFKIGDCSLPVIIVSPGDTYTSVGGTKDLTAEALYFDGHTEDVTNSAVWNSSDTSIATVGTTGRVAGVAAGEVTIRADYTFNGTVTRGIADLHILANDVSVVSIAIDGETKMPFNATQQLYAWANMSDGSTQSITNEATWSLHDVDPQIATIDASGKVQSHKIAAFIDALATYGDLSLAVHTIEIYSGESSILKDVRFVACGSGEEIEKINLQVGETRCVQAFAVYTNEEDGHYLDSHIIKNYFRNIDIAYKGNYIELTGTKAGKDMLSVVYNNKINLIPITIQ